MRFRNVSFKAVLKDRLQFSSLFRWKLNGNEEDYTDREKLGGKMKGRIDSRNETFEYNVLV